MTAVPINPDFSIKQQCLLIHSISPEYFSRIDSLSIFLSLLLFRLSITSIPNAVIYVFIYFLKLFLKLLFSLIFRKRRLSIEFNPKTAESKKDAASYRSSLGGNIQEFPIPFGWHPTELGLFAVGAHNSNSVLLSNALTETIQQQKSFEMSRSGSIQKPLVATRRLSKGPGITVYVTLMRAMCHSRLYCPHTEIEIEKPDICKNMIFTEETKRASRVVEQMFGFRPSH